MTAQWENRRPDRPDRYLDWEFANRSAAESGLEARWCSALIQVRIGPSSNPGLHLRNLHDYVLSEQQKRSFAIGMYENERELLQSVVDDVEAGCFRPKNPEDPRLSFFVYLPEQQAYTNGDFAQFPDYRVRLVGAPIDISGSDKKIRLDRTPFQPLSSGRPVAIGIIDDGIAFAHRRFRRQDDTGRERTRIQAIWLQDREHPGLAETDWMAFGKRLMASDIDRLLEDAALATGSIDDTEVYRLAGLLDFGRSDHKSMALRAAHGTHVMDLAGGYDPDDPAGPGLNRPLLAVQLPASVTADTSGVTMGSYVLQGLRQIMLWADKIDNGRPAPLVVNFSYGFLAGPKDGWHDLEREIDRLVRDRRDRLDVETAVVLPAGNAYRSRTSARMKIAPDATDHLDWVVLPDDGTASFVEIWSHDPGLDGGPPQVGVTLSPPDDEPAGAASVSGPGQARMLRRGGRPVAGLYWDAPAGRAGAPRTRITLAVNPTRVLDSNQVRAAAGSWRISVKNNSGRALDVALYVQRDDTPAGFRLKGRQSYFDHPLAYAYDPQTGNYEGLGEYQDLAVAEVGDGAQAGVLQRPKDHAPACPITHAGTLSAIGTGRETTVLVGGALDGDRLEPAVYTSSGPTVSRCGPDFACVSDQGRAHVGMLAAGTLTGSTVALRGTSVAAPQLARRLADLGGNVRALREQCQAGEQPDPQLGCAVVLQVGRSDLPERLRPRRPTDSGA